LSPLQRNTDAMNFVDCPNEHAADGWHALL
jgi:hypothetical protein